MLTFRNHFISVQCDKAIMMQGKRYWRERTKLKRTGFKESEDNDRYRIEIFEFDWRT